MKAFKLGPWEVRIARSHWWEQSVDMELDFSHFLKAEVRQLLEHHGCKHGHNMDNTPPMFYPEALACALARAKDTIREAAVAPAPKARGKDGGA